MEFSSYHSVVVWFVRMYEQMTVHYFEYGLHLVNCSHGDVLLSGPSERNCDHHELHHEGKWTSQWKSAVYPVGVYKTTSCFSKFPYLSSVFTFVSSNLKLHVISVCTELYIREFPHLVILCMCLCVTA